MSAALTTVAPLPTPSRAHPPAAANAAAGLAVDKAMPLDTATSLNPAIDPKIAELADLLRTQFMPSPPTSETIAALSGQVSEPDVAPGSPMIADAPDASPNEAPMRQEDIDVLRERTQTRPDVVEHNGYLIDPVGTRDHVTVDVFQDGAWQPYCSPEVQLENGMRVPGWSEVRDFPDVTKVKEIQLGENRGTLPVSGNRGEMLVIQLPKELATEAFQVVFGAENGGFTPITYSRRGDEYYAAVITVTSYTDATFAILPTSSRPSV